MKRSGRKNQAADSAKANEPKWWKKDIVAPIMVGIILSIVGFGIWAVQKSSEEKYGELLIASNVDSAEVFLNEVFKGFTQTSTVKRIEMLQSGVYLLSVKKNGFADVDTSIKIVAGEITSVKADLRLVQTPEKDLAVAPKPAADSATMKLAGAIKSYQITITVHSKLKDAKIMIDGKWVANAPNTISLPKGQYHLRIENELYYYKEMLQVPSRNLVNVAEGEIKEQ